MQAFSTKERTRRSAKAGERGVEQDTLRPAAVHFKNNDEFARG